ncbi:MAG: dipeptide ABC transporter ATP-binding protein [Thermomicrobiales bacterium]
MSGHGTSSRATPFFAVENLTVTYRGETRQTVVRDVSFALHAREAYGLVGESGSGKSTIALAAMRYLPANGRVADGRILFDGQDLLRLPAGDLRRLRGNRIAMVYQDPGAALNPTMTVGDQVAEVFTAHQGYDRTRARAAAVEIFERVRMPGAADVALRYPHQLSGGMQQRAIIAMALASNPSLLILDEPTTGLDATVEAAVLDLIAAIRGEFDAAILLISHNLAVVSQLCDRVGVLYAGELVEEGPTAELFSSPQHPYTAGLLSCVPRGGMRKDTDPLRPIPGRMPRLGEEFPGCPYAPRCPLARQVCHQEKPALFATTPGRHARCFFWPEVESSLAARDRRAPAVVVSGSVSGPNRPALLEVHDAAMNFGQPPRQVRAVNDVSFEVRQGEVFGLVGESGSGKSTLARGIAGLLALNDGTIALDGRDISRPVEQRERGLIKRIQMVFQSPEATLNPRQTVRQMLRRTAKALTGRRGAALHERVEELARLVHLDAALLDSYPSGLSGGQRQRVAIARAFAGDPDIVLCDEPVSNLDVSVQATILTLLADLQERQSVSYVFISHDLGVVRYLADRVGVMYLGALVEVGPVDRVFAPPFHPYTETLFAAMPSLDGTRVPVRAEGSMPSAAEIPSGCPFHTRCPRMLGEQCRTQEPPWRETVEGHAYRCWIPPQDLAQMQEEVWEPPNTVRDTARVMRTLRVMPT